MTPPQCPVCKTGIRTPKPGGTSPGSCQVCGTRLDDTTEDVAATTPDPLLGSMLGKYGIDELVGEGATAKVYRGRDIGLDRVVAIKVIKSEFAKDPTLLQRFHREAKTVARFKTRHVVQVYDVSFDRRRHLHYIALEFVDSGTLRELAFEKGKSCLAPDAALGFLEQAAEGLAEAARLDIVHRDIKPDNLLVDAAGGLKIADFGISRIQDSAIEMTNPGQWLGTPLYMSPEQCRRQKVDFRSDMFSLGASFFYLLTGERPASATTWDGVMDERSATEYLSPRQYAQQEIPDEIDQIIRKMTALSPKDRFPSFEALIEECERVRSTAAQERRQRTVTNPKADDKSPPDQKEHPREGTRENRRSPRGSTADRRSSLSTGARKNDSSLTETGSRLLAARRQQEVRRRRQRRVRIAAFSLLGVLAIPLTIWFLSGNGGSTTPVPPGAHADLEVALRELANKLEQLTPTSFRIENGMVASRLNRLEARVNKRVLHAVSGSPHLREKARSLKRTVETLRSRFNRMTRYTREEIPSDPRDAWRKLRRISSDYRDQLPIPFAAHLAERSKAARTAWIEHRKSDAAKQIEVARKEAQETSRDKPTELTREKLTGLERRVLDEPSSLDEDLRKEGVSDADTRAIHDAAERSAKTIHGWREAVSKSLERLSAEERKKRLGEALDTFERKLAGFLKNDTLAVRDWRSLVDELAIHPPESLAERHESLVRRLGDAQRSWEGRLEQSQKRLATLRPALHAWKLPLQYEKKAEKESDTRQLQGWATSAKALTAEAGRAPGLPAEHRSKIREVETRIRKTLLEVEKIPVRVAGIAGSGWVLPPRWAGKILESRTTDGTTRVRLHSDRLNTAMPMVLIVPRPFVHGGTDNKPAFGAFLIDEFEVPMGHVAGPGRFLQDRDAVFERDSIEIDRAFWTRYLKQGRKPALPARYLAASVARDFAKWIGKSLPDADEWLYAACLKRGSDGQPDTFGDGGRWSRLEGYRSVHATEHRAEGAVSPLGVVAMRTHVAEFCNPAKGTALRAAFDANHGKSLEHKMIAVVLGQVSVRRAKPTVGLAQEPADPITASPRSPTFSANTGFRLIIRLRKPH